MTITEQIKALAADVDHIAPVAMFDLAELKALAESHERLLAELRRAWIGLAHDNLKEAIEEAEKL
jgi:hypothetical protein